MGERAGCCVSERATPAESLQSQLVKHILHARRLCECRHEEVYCNGFSGANVVLTNKKNGEFRALMLIQRMVNKNGGHKLILSCTGGQRNSIEEDAWTCACREEHEETGGFAWFATTPPANASSYIYVDTGQGIDGYQIQGGGLRSQGGGGGVKVHVVRQEQLCLF